MKSISKFILLSLTAAGWLGAQNPKLPPGFPGGGPGAEAPGPSQSMMKQLVTPDPNGQFPGALEYPSATAYDIATIYQDATGKRVLVPTAVKDVQFSLMQSGGMTNRETADLIEQFLLIEGYRLSPYERNPNIVTLLGVNQAGGNASVIVPPKVITDSAQLALQDGVVSYVMKFQYLKPEEALRTFTAIYQQLSPGGTIAEVSNASSLIITEKAALIESLIKLKREIDVPSAELGREWVEVVFADVQQLSEQLNEIFNAQSSQNQSAGVQRRQANTTPIPGVAAAAQGGSGAGEEIPPQIIPDLRTGRILLLGRPIDIVFIKELIAQWDVESSDRNFLHRKLKYLPVYEFIPIAESAINGLLGDTAEGGAAGGGGGRSTAGQNNRDLGNNNNNNQNNNNQGGVGGAGASSTASVGGSARPTEPESLLVGNTLLVGDNVANNIIVRGPPHHIELVERLADELDVRQEQVAISAVFGRYSITDGLSFGVNLGQLLNGNGIGFGTGNDGGGGIISGDTITQFSNLVTPGAGFAGAAIGGDFGVFVNALESATQFKAFARPTIYTTNNEVASISSGTQIAIPTNTFNGGVNGGGQSTNFEYRNVALELEVLPLVNSADEITLEISIVRDTIGEDRTVGDLDIPDLLSDTLNTIVTVPVGSAVLLGGLIDEDTTNSDSGVPILRAIPVLGNLFKSTSDEFRRSELVIMIRPTIVDGQVSFENYQNVYDSTSNLSGEARQQFSAPPHVYDSRGVAGRLLDSHAPNRFNRSSSQQVAKGQSTVQPQQDPAQIRRGMSPVQQMLYDKQQRRLKEGR